MVKPKFQFLHLNLTTLVNLVKIAYLLIKNYFADLKGIFQVCVKISSQSKKELKYKQDMVK